MQALLQRVSCACCVLLLYPQVRSVSVGEIGIITGSRDTTIKIWSDDAPDTCSLLQTLVSREENGVMEPVRHQLASSFVLQSCHLSLLHPLHELPA
jgi:hypothetical protein